MTDIGQIWLKSAEGSLTKADANGGPGGGYLHGGQLELTIGQQPEAGGMITIATTCLLEWCKRVSLANLVKWEEAAVSRAATNRKNGGASVNDTTHVSKQIYENQHNYVEQVE